eukprot:3107720-Pyramimonas_sp.AAC.1
MSYSTHSLTYSRRNSSLLHRPADCHCKSICTCPHTEANRDPRETRQSQKFSRRFVVLPQIMRLVAPSVAKSSSYCWPY